MSAGAALRPRRRRARRALAWSGRILGLLALALLLGVLVPRQPSAFPPAERRHTILVLSSAIHTDIALPAEPSVVARFGFLAEEGLPVADPRVAYVLVGRGGRSFYLETPDWGALRPGPVLRSLGLDRAVMRIALAGPIDRQAPDVRRFEVGDAELEALTGFVLAELTRGADGAPLALAEQPAAYGAYSRFFEAEGRFNALWGCNLWTAQALGSAGVTTGLWTPLPALLDLSLDLHAG